MHTRQIQVWAKTASDSSWLGRYLASGTMRYLANLEKPYAMAGAAGATGVPPVSLVPFVGDTLNEAAMARAHLADADDEDNPNREYERTLLRSADMARRDSYPGIMGKAIRQTFPSGLLTAAMMGAAPWVSSKLPDSMDPLGLRELWNGRDPEGKAKLVALLAGAGLLGTAVFSGLGAASAKLVMDHTSDETRRRAARLKSKRPYLTSLPMGDVVGAAL